MEEEQVTIVVKTLTGKSVPLVARLSDTLLSFRAEFKRLIVTEVTRWRQLVKRLGIAPS